MPELQTRPADGPHDDRRDERDDGEDPQRVHREADAAEDQGEEQEHDEESDHAAGVPAPPPGYRGRFAPLALLDRRASSLGCASCGACCVGVMLSWHPQRRESVSTPYYAQHWHVLWADNRPDLPAPSYVVECDSYDAEHNRCGDYENRPVACRGYPWYEEPPTTGSEPDHGLVRHRADGVVSCSYYLDAPGWSELGARPLLPLTVIS